MTLPVSGGVPEQGPGEATQRLEPRAAAQGITVLEAELQDAVIESRRELNRLCGGGKFQMTIPVDLQRDSDVILGNLVALADKLVFESEKRGAALERPRPALPAPEPPDQKESESMSEKPYSRAESMESALRDLLAVAWDFLEECATKEQLSEAAVRARRRLEA